MEVGGGGLIGVWRAWSGWVGGWDGLNHEISLLLLCKRIVAMLDRFNGEVMIANSKY